MNEKIILFDHLMNGLDMAAFHFYDLSPLVQKTFSGSEIRMIMKRLSKFVTTNDTSWHASNKLYFIEKKNHSCAEIKSLKNYRDNTFILIDNYEPENLGTVFSTLSDSYTLSDKDPSNLKRKLASFCSSHLRLADRLFTLYGEKEYFAKFKTDLFEKAVIEIFGLKKFPEKFIFKSLTNRYSSLCESPFYSDVFHQNEKITEYIKTVEKYCPQDLKAEITELMTNQNKLEEEVGNINTNIQSILKKIMNCVKEEISQ